MYEIARMKHRRDEARRDCFASLAMTADGIVKHQMLSLQGARSATKQSPPPGWAVAFWRNEPENSFWQNEPEGLAAMTSSSIRCITNPAMSDALKARDAKDVEDAVRWALAEGKTLEVVGRGTKRALGRPSQSDLTLDLSGLSGVTLYEPEELVLSAKAGTLLAEIEALVESKGQQLAFEPMDYGPILGQPADAGSLGGALAANLSGPRRIKAGAARDHFLGFSAVSGRAETFKSGGRVVKNVTGYDLCKLLGGLVRHAGGDDRSHDQGAAAPGDRSDRAGARSRRRQRQRGDVGGDGVFL